MAAQAQAQGGPSPKQVNDMIRQQILKSAVDMVQPVYSAQTFTSGPGTVINIAPRNVGLLKRFFVEVTATVANSAGQTQALAPFGPANFFSQVVFTDLSNQQRINTSGIHLVAVSTGKRRRVWTQAMSGDTPFGYGNVYNVNKAPASIAASSNGTVNLLYEVPLSYTDTDLRGAIYMNVVNATANLQLTVNPNMFVASTGDPTLAMYQSSTATLATLPSFTVTVYQNYLDQLPMMQSQGGGATPMLPQLDLSTVYLLNNSAVSGFTANTDVPIPYANFRDFQSTFLIFDNGGTLNAGTDISRFQLQAANYTALFYQDPTVTAGITRALIMDDFPKGAYYFDHRQRPISTVNYGNMQLVVTPTTVNAGAQFLVAWESLALINLITQAGSLYGN